LIFVAFAFAELDVGAWAPLPEQTHDLDVAPILAVQALKAMLLEGLEGRHTSARQGRIKAQFGPVVIPLIGGDHKNLFTQLQEVELFFGLVVARAHQLEVLLLFADRKRAQQTGLAVGRHRPLEGLDDRGSGAFGDVVLLPVRLELAVDLPDRDRQLGARQLLEAGAAALEEGVDHDRRLGPATGRTEWSNFSTSLVEVGSPSLWVTVAAISSSPKRYNKVVCWKARPSCSARKRTAVARAGPWSTSLVSKDWRGPKLRAK
jgi:hypothetical protein